MMKKKIVFRITAAICAAACVVSIGQAVRIHNEYKQGEEEYDHLADILVSTPNTSIYVSKNDPASSDAEHAPIDVNFDLLKEMNVNAVGWLYSEGTLINYPVVQSTDNSYYLKHLFNDQTNSSGAIFMDANNSPDLSDINTIIYGHNMKNGTMFASLANYSTQRYYGQHPVIYYLTPDCDYRIDVFASYETPDASETFSTSFDSADSYYEYLGHIRDKSLINVWWVEVLPDDNIVTLSTCGYNFQNSRYVVQGKVTPLNKATEDNY